ncbi:hypothetical protein CU097_014980 [Rhizopus azygosporus]|uniref:Ribonuclease H n=1 Tax=Rhizopus azygosporus TaxID=86630 RepID=A0A367K695_RHIAZ|nr:hypothetical protein CU097_014980 [Rhizopus azygosporus]
MGGYYAVRVGRHQGIYRNWSECKEQVNGVSGAKFKKFDSLEEAQDFVDADSSSYSQPSYSRSRNSRSNYSHSNDSGYNYSRSNSRANDSNNYSRSTDCYEEEEVYSTPRNTQSQTYQRYSPYASQRTHPKKTVVYTDGASAGNGQVGAQAGYGVYWGDNDPRNLSRPLEGTRQTNQRAEATAVMRALEQSAANEPLEIRTDSQYVIKAVNQWSKSWKDNGWKSSKGTPVENRDILEKIVDIIDHRKAPVEVVYVPGHSGEEGNEKADRLAVAGAKRTR